MTLVTGVPSVSFVVPVHDGAAYLAECLTSILAQTMAPLEVLVVDDGSSDGSGDVARAFGAPVRCLRQAQAGPGSARNRGVAAARGDLVAFLDADDLIPPHKLERQLACFAASPGLQFCDAWARNFWSPEIAPAERNPRPREAFTHGEAPKPRHLGTWLVRRSLFARLGGFDATLTFGEDEEWRDRVDASGVPAVTLDEVLAMRRLHPGNLTRRRYDEYLRHVARRCRERVRRARAPVREVVSCVIPVHDGARYVGEAIQSVLAQTRPPDEVVVVDDGSTDGTGREVARFGSAVLYVRQAHAGVSVARNQGVAFARGGLISFLDADDRLDPRRLELQTAELERRPEVDLCDALSGWFWSEELTPAERQADHRYASPFWHEARPGHVGTWLVRRAALERIGPFDPALRFSEDTDWLLRFRDGGGVAATLPVVLGHRRLHPGNATAGSRSEQVAALARVLKRSRDRRRGAVAGG